MSQTANNVVSTRCRQQCRIVLRNQQPTVFTLTTRRHECFENNNSHPNTTGQLARPGVTNQQQVTNIIIINKITNNNKSTTRSLHKYHNNGSLQ